LSRDYFSWYTNAAGAMHALGRYADELALARDARTRQPDRYAHTLAQSRALIGLGRFDDLDQLLTASRSMPWYRAPGQLMHDVGMELWAHGRHDEARAMWQRAIEWHLGQPAGSPEDRMIQQNIAVERYFLGQYAEARPLFAALAAQFPADRLYRAGQAFVAAKTGDTSFALRTAAELRADTAANDRYAARILALLGRREEAVAALRAYLNRGGRFVLRDWHTDLELDPLRDYAAFVALVALKD
jgi:tetratricopeptide (TPR) repeat protein